MDTSNNTPFNCEHASSKFSDRSDATRFKYIVPKSANNT